MPACRQGSEPENVMARNRRHPSPENEMESDGRTCRHCWLDFCDALSWRICALDERSAGRTSKIQIRRRCELRGLSGPVLARAERFWLVFFESRTTRRLAARHTV